MGQLPYKPKESGEEWASHKGYLARNPDTPECIERQKRIGAEKKRKATDAKFREILIQVNKLSEQVYFCSNCNSEVRVTYKYCDKCGFKLPWQTER